MGKEGWKGIKIVHPVLTKRSGEVKRLAKGDSFGLAGRHVSLHYHRFGCFLSRHNRRMFYTLRQLRWSLFDLQHHPLSSWRRRIKAHEPGPQFARQATRRIMASRLNQHTSHHYPPRSPKHHHHSNWALSPHNPGNQNYILAFQTIVPALPSDPFHLSSNQGPPRQTSRNGRLSKSSEIETRTRPNARS